MKSKLKSRRKRTLKQWGAFARRGFKKREYKHNRLLHEYEHQIILRDALAMGGSFTAATLKARHPDRYDEKVLPSALKRMGSAGLLDSKGVWGRSPMYTVREAIREAAA